MFINTIECLPPVVYMSDDDDTDREPLTERISVNVLNNCR